MPIYIETDNDDALLEAIEISKMGNIIAEEARNERETILDLSSGAPTIGWNQFAGMMADNQAILANTQAKLDELMDNKPEPEELGLFGKDFEPFVRHVTFMHKAGELTDKTVCGLLNTVNETNEKKTFDTKDKPGTYHSILKSSLESSSLLFAALGHPLDD